MRTQIQRTGNPATTGITGPASSVRANALSARAETREPVQEGNELIAIVTAIIRNKRRNMARNLAREDDRTG